MRLFFAVGIPEEVRIKLVEILRELRGMGLQASIVKDAQLHITLLFLGEKSEEETRSIIRKVRNMRLPAFRISIRSVGFFPDEKRPRVFWIGAEAENGELKMLQEELCRSLDLTPENNFTGHITLARIKGGKNLELLLEMKKSMENREFGSFTVGDFLLMRSELGPEGAKYSVVEKFDLG